MFHSTLIGSVRGSWNRSLTLLLQAQACWLLNVHLYLIIFLSTKWGYSCQQFLCNFRFNRWKIIKNCTQEWDKIYLASVKQHFSVSNVLPLYFIFPVYTSTLTDKSIITPSLCKTCKVNIHINQEQEVNTPQKISFLAFFSQGNTWKKKNRFFLRSHREN